MIIIIIKIIIITNNNNNDTDNDDNNNNNNNRTHSLAHIFSKNIAIWHIVKIYKSELYTNKLTLV